MLAKGAQDFISPICCSVADLLKKSTVTLHACTVSLIALPIPAFRWGANVSGFLQVLTGYGDFLCQICYYVFFWSQMFNEKEFYRFCMYVFLGM